VAGDPPRPRGSPGAADSAPFVAEVSTKQAKRVHGLRLLLAWLEAQPGASWQERWIASGADSAGAAWRQMPTRWLQEQGPSGSWREATLIEALPVAVSADLVRPSLSWLVSGGPARGGLLVRTMAASRDPAGFARIQSCDGQVGVTGTTGSQLRYRAALIAAAKGGDVASITVGDVHSASSRIALVIVEPHEPHPRPRQHGAEHVQPFSTPQSMTSSPGAQTAGRCARVRACPCRYLLRSVATRRTNASRFSAKGSAHTPSSHRPHPPSLGLRP
jgi:hypothetical protein